MELTLGTEPQHEYFSLELAGAARKLVEEAVPLEPGQNLLVTADTGSDWRAVMATAKAAYAMGATPTVVLYPTGDNPCQDPPAPVAKAVAAADVWIEFSVAYILYSAAHEAAMEAGCQYLCISGMDADMMVRAVGRADCGTLREMTQVLYRLSQEATTIRMTGPGGTDLTVEIDKEGDPYWEPPTPGRGFSHMLAGQSGFASVLDSFEGVLVFDATLWPPADLGILRDPVALHIEKGIVKRVEGGSEARRFEKWLASFGSNAMYQVDHVCYGFNPGITRPSGRILEDERIFGCLQFGIGTARLGAPSHTDGVVLNPSVWADDVQLEDEGAYVHPELAALCGRMGIPGYR
jgi:leucyl aminopeptidase (aminopeptidase T)